MESIPRITSLSFPLRRPGPDHLPDFRTQIKTFIQDHYGEDSESYNKEITELETLRSSAVQPTIDNSGCALLKKYFCQLNFLRSRFPIREQGPCIISFSWTNVFTDVINNHSNIDFEMASILYNIGSLHSTLGSLANRETPEGIKEACTHFQCSAWAFQNLRQNQAKYLQYFSPDDITGEIIGIMQALCLAQAQECILEKSFIDKRKSTINVKVAIQIYEFYANIIKSLDFIKESRPVKLSDKLVKQLKKWKQMSELKLNFYNAISYLYLGLQAEEDKKMGIRITFYEASKEKLTCAFKLAKSYDKNDSIHETLNFTSEYVTGKLTESKKDNENVYHEKVPDLNEANLTEIKGVSLVKGIPFKFDDQSISGPDIFSRLIPMETHEVSSLYSEEKAKILRNYSTLCEKKNESLENFTVSFLYDQLELTISNEDLQELVDSCASLNVDRDAVGKLTSMMTHLSGMFVDVESSLKEIEDIFIIEDGKENEYNELMKGIPDKNGALNQNNILIEIRSEFLKYSQAQGLASKTNQTLYEVMSDHVSNLQILVQPFDDVLKVIPSQPVLSEKDEKVIGQMSRIRIQIEEMQKQRQDLENQLRESVINDDITKVLLIVNENQDLQSVFQQELQKHGKITNQLDVNFTQQDALIKEVEELADQLGDVKKATSDLRQRRENKISSLLISYQSYEELLSKCTKGIDFYEKLKGNLEVLLKRLKNAITIEEERREMNLNCILGTNRSIVISTVPSIDFNLVEDQQQEQQSTSTSTSSSSEVIQGDFKVETPPPSYSYVQAQESQDQEDSLNNSIPQSPSSVLPSVLASISISTTKPKLKDYLDLMKKVDQNEGHQGQPGGHQQKIKEYLDMIQDNRNSSHFSPQVPSLDSISIPGPSTCTSINTYAGHSGQSQPKLKDCLDRMRQTEYQLELPSTSMTGQSPNPTVQQPKLKDYLEKMKNTGVSKPHLDMIDNYSGQRSNNFEVPQPQTQIFQNHTQDYEYAANYPCFSNNMPVSVPLKALVKREKRQIEEGLNNLQSSRSTSSITSSSNTSNNGISNISSGHSNYTPYYEQSQSQANYQYQYQPTTTTGTTTENNYSYPAATVAPAATPVEPVQNYNLVSSLTTMTPSMYTGHHPHGHGPGQNEPYGIPISNISFGHSQYPYEYHQQQQQHATTTNTTTTTGNIVPEQQYSYNYNYTSQIPVEAYTYHPQPHHTQMSENIPNLVIPGQPGSSVASRGVDNYGYYDNTHSVQVITNPIVESTPTGENQYQENSISNYSNYFNDNQDQGQVVINSLPESSRTNYENVIPSGDSSISVVKVNQNSQPGPAGIQESPIYDNSTVDSIQQPQYQQQNQQVYTSVQQLQPQVEQPFFSNYYYQQSLLDKPTVYKSDSLIMSFPITGGGHGHVQQANPYQTGPEQQQQSYFPITNSYQQLQQQGYYSHSPQYFDSNSSQNQQLQNYEPPGNYNNYNQNYVQYPITTTTLNDGNLTGYSGAGPSSIVQAQQHQPQGYYEQHQQVQVQNQQENEGHQSNIDLLSSLNDLDFSTISVPLVPVQVNNSTTTTTTATTTSENEDLKQQNQNQ